LLTVKRANTIANRLLAAFVIVIAIGVGGSTMASDRFIVQYPHFLKIQDPFTLAGAPLLFLYIRTLIKGRSGLSKKHLLHFIPFALCLVLLLPFYFQGAEAKLISVGSNFDYWKRWSQIRSTTLIVQFIVYLSLIASTLVTYTKNLKRETSPAQQSVLFQIRFMLITLTAVWVIGSLKFAITTIYPAFNTETVDLTIPASLSLFVYAMAYLGLRRPEILTGPNASPSPRYQGSTLTIERASAYRQRVLDLMNTEKPYLDSDLTLQKLAKAVSISPHHLSQTINEQLNQSFIDFINAYRIEEAKKMLVDTAKKHYSILAVSEEVGFNSKSAFNTAFKKHARTTPSEFRSSNNGGS
ncbi:MAG TPA: helix-turn-helix transcriptional regulator, partial [Pyrinomonadaceae bacterium]|nr:helix-turn-helix transcriptional regulator [Pyrinomonadaceae bacterium]